MMHEFSHAFCRIFIHTAFLCRLLAKLISFLVTKPEMHTARFYGRRGGDVDDVDSGSSSDEDDISMDADSDDEFQPTNSDISSSEFSLQNPILTMPVLYPQPTQIYNSRKDRILQIGKRTFQLNLKLYFLVEVA